MPLRVSFREESFSHMAAHQKQHKSPTVLCIGDCNDDVFIQIQKICQLRTSAIDWNQDSSLEINPSQVKSLSPHDWVLVHRRNIGPTEVESITRLRHLIEAKGPERPRLELILGDLARYADVQTLAAMSDRITPEGIAAEVLSGRIRRLTGKPLTIESTKSQSRSVGLLSRSRPLMEMLADWVRFCGLQPVIMDGWSDPQLPAGSLMIWDVPVLNDRWETELRAQSRRRPIIALLGMATRDLTEKARSAGASACLDLPFETDDLTDVILANLPKTEGTPLTKRPTSNPESQTIIMRSGKTVLRAEGGHQHHGEHRHLNHSGKANVNSTAKKRIESELA